MDVQFYEHDKEPEARVWERNAVIKIVGRRGKKLTRRTVRALLRRLGYRLGNWEETDWGCAAKAQRHG